MNGKRLASSRTLRILWLAFAVMLALSVAAEVFIHPHARFGMDGSFGFHAWFGGAACVGIVAVSKLLGIFLKRKDTYYDE